ncbi:MAG: aldo/keto reductase [Acidobacteria bacterium]|nr:aldo/keto reductase [Acidobacteriota bacterium]MCB9396937.1 aldo/keto reductase [Acidobacteriota bacterium]
MLYRKLGQTGLDVSVVCLGTMTWGEQNSEAEAHQQLDYAKAHGVNFIDTAEMYPVPGRAETQGSTERYLGSWLKNQNRADWIIATKVIAHSGIDWIRTTSDLSSDGIRTAVDASLKRLQTDYIDLYQIHWPDRYSPKFGQNRFDPKMARPGMPIEETLAVLGELIQAGKIRFIGVSNETPWGLSQYIRAAETQGLPRIQTLQNAYNLVNRVFEIHLAENCYHDGIGLLAYSPLAFGHLTAKYLTGSADARARLNLFPQFGQRYQKPNLQRAIRQLLDCAGDYGLTAMSLQYVKAHQLCNSVIIGATSLDQLAENISALQSDLPSPLLSELNRLYQDIQNPCP